jgi:biofilm PGA synthesis N-glycosyltransferase PgaC
MIELLLTIFIISVVIGMTLSMLMLIGSSVYDIDAISRKGRPQGLSKTRLRRYRPLVSVVIPAYNEELTIERCLDNLRKVRYKNLEIIVSDDCSKDNTKRLVREYIRNNPKRNIKLYAARKNGGRGAAINRGVTKAEGEIIVAFDADCAFSPKSVHKMVAHFADEKVQAIAANVRIIDGSSVLSMMQQLEYLVSFRSKKFNTITNSEYIIGGAGASYRRTALKKAGGFNDKMKTEDIELSVRMTRLFGKKSGLRYASDYVVYTQAVPSVKALLRQRYRWKFGSLQAIYNNRSLLFSFKKDQNYFTTLVRLPFGIWSELMLLLEPVLFSIFLYYALTYKNPWLFISACIAYSAIGWLAIWSDEHYDRAEKFKLSFLAPFMYPASIIISLIQVYAAFKSVIHFQEVIGRKSVTGAYITTQRAAAQELRTA